MLILCASMDTVASYHRWGTSNSSVNAPTSMIWREYQMVICTNVSLGTGHK